MIAAKHQTKIARNRRSKLTFLQIRRLGQRRAAQRDQPLIRCSRPSSENDWLLPIERLPQLRLMFLGETVKNYVSRVIFGD
jgi:hypothetical protein